MGVRVDLSHINTPAAVAAGGGGEGEAGCTRSPQAANVPTCSPHTPPTTLTQHCHWLPARQRSVLHCAAALCNTLYASTLRHTR